MLRSFHHSHLLRHYCATVYRSILVRSGEFTNPLAVQILGSLKNGWSPTRMAAHWLRIFATTEVADGIERDRQSAQLSRPHNQSRRNQPRLQEIRTDNNLSSQQQNPSPKQTGQLNEADSLLSQPFLVLISSCRKGVDDNFSLTPNVLVFNFLEGVLAWGMVHRRMSGDPRIDADMHTCQKV